ncbi:hypothetical protein [Daejeonella sp.]|uniref:hypothetical protein n=1 Tax=Daejeonella sp. TaxID=2805397 RepID=UPI003983A15E
MRTILVIAGIVLAGATVIAVVQNDKKGEAAPEIQQAVPSQVGSAEPLSSRSATPATNPAHGLAGHRCDLPVGAPLSSASGAAAPVQNPPTINMNPMPVQSAPTLPAAGPTPSAAGVKINPAHGLPGHRCDVQVGAPLT